MVTFIKDGLIFHWYGLKFTLIVTMLHPINFLRRDWNKFWVPSSCFKYSFRILFLIAIMFFLISRLQCVFHKWQVQPIIKRWISCPLCPRGLVTLH